MDESSEISSEMRRTIPTTTVTRNCYAEDGFEGG